MKRPDTGRLLDSCDPELDARYTKAVDEWLRLEDPADIAAEYDGKVFPLALARMERDAAARPTAALLILSVGTQPYSPQLVATGVPAASAGLISTSLSLPIARRLEEELQDRGVTTDLRIAESGGISRTEIAELIIRIYRTAGEPPPEQTVIDLTSGRKPTTAAMASAADALGAMNCYLEADFHRHPHGGYATGERLVLDGPLPLGGAVATLEAARALGRAGLLRGAARHIASRGEHQYLPPALRAARHLFNAAASLLEGRPAAAATAYRRALRELPRSSRLATLLEDSWTNGWAGLARGDSLAYGACLGELRPLLPRNVQRAGGPSPPGRRVPLRLRRAVSPPLHWLFGIRERS